MNKPRKLPKHCSEFKDRHGKPHVKFRRDGFQTYLHGTPWSDIFMREYAAAMEHKKVEKVPGSIGASRTVAGTVGELVAAYLDCAPNSSSPLSRNDAIER